MSRLVVNNPNIVIDAPSRPPARRRADRAPRSDAEAAMIRLLRRIRREIDELVCSSVWAEDCLYRGAEYPPDFRCSCPACRNKFPHRRHPRPVRESAYSIDCQVEAEEDPEFAEEFSRLRNDRERYGSVFIGRSSGSAAHDASRSRR